MLERLEAHLEVVSGRKPGRELRLANAAFGLRDPVLVAKQLGSAPSGRRGLGTLIPLVAGFL
jgi:hypothetical protein